VIEKRCQDAAMNHTGTILMIRPEVKARANITVFPVFKLNT
jgi:hypothetical protein